MNEREEKRRTPGQGLVYQRLCQLPLSYAAYMISQVS